MSSVNTQITFLKDDTIRVQAIIKDFDGTLLDPSSDSVVFYDPSGTNMGTYATTKIGSGTYRTDFIIPSGGTAGDWKCSWKVLSGTFPAREVIHFVVGGS